MRGLLDDSVTHGVCFGGGLQIALGADFRYASDTANPKPKPSPYTIRLRP